MSSFPPPGFIATDSALPGIEVYKPAPQVESHRPVVEFSCPQCGGRSAYSVTDGGLTCTQCGHHETPKKAAVGRSAESFEFKVETMQRAAQGWGESRKTLACQNCGSEVSLAPTDLTHTCPFCASTRVLQRESPQEVLRPRFLIPFGLERDDCQSIFGDWLGNHWLTPRPLRALAHLHEFTGIYLPFWTFEAGASADWKAEVGHEETERYFEDGQWKSRTVIKWRWESGSVTRSFSNVLIPGAEQVDRALLGKVSDFDIEGLVPYEASYLAGFQAQAQSVPLETAWQAARQHMREQTKHACYGDASTSRVRNLSMELDFREESWRYILLPFYLATYLYQEKPYHVAINGQRGTIAGPRPADWRKLWLIVAAFLIPGIVALAVALTLATAGLAQALAIGGGVLIAVGLVAALLLVTEAQRLQNG